MSYNPHVSNDPKVLRSGAVTNTLDAAPSTLRAQNWNQIVFLFDVVLDTATDVRIRFDVASPGTSSGRIIDDEPAAASTDWYPLTYQDNSTASTSGGVTTVTGNVFELKYTQTGRYAYPLPANYKWIRAKAKVTGGPGAATLSITATTGMS